MCCQLNLIIHLTGDQSCSKPTRRLSQILQQYLTERDNGRECVCVLVFSLSNYMYID